MNEHGILLCSFISIIIYQYLKVIMSSSRELCQLLVKILKIGRLQVVKVRVVAETHPAVPEVHALLGHHVDQGHLCLVLTQELLVVLPRYEPEDGVALGHLDLAVNVVGEVREVEAK